MIDIPEDLVIIIESDEQIPLFLQRGSLSKSKDYEGELVTTRRSLPVGDYSLKGFEHEIVFERKRAEELFSCLVDPLWSQSEKAKFVKISDFRWKWLIIESREEDVFRYQDFSKMSPNFIRSKLVEIELRLRIPVCFASSRQEAERFILYRCCKFLRLKRDGQL